MHEERKRCAESTALPQRHAIPIHPALAPLFAEYYATRVPLTEQAVFVGVHGNRLHYTQLGQVFRHYVDAAGVNERKRVTPHTLRQVFASELLRAGANLRQIQELLGHKHLDSTQRYTRVNAHEAALDVLERVCVLYEMRRQVRRLEGGRESAHPLLGVVIAGDRLAVAQVQHRLARVDELRFWPLDREVPPGCADTGRELRLARPTVSDDAEQFQGDHDRPSSRGYLRASTPRAKRMSLSAWVKADFKSCVAML
jgi:hypothetical protein